MAEMRSYAKLPKSEEKDIIYERIKVSDKDKIILDNLVENILMDQEEWDRWIHIQPKVFKQVVEDMIQYYSLTNESSILDIGCKRFYVT